MTWSGLSSNNEKAIPNGQAFGKDREYNWIAVKQYNKIGQLAGQTLLSPIPVCWLSKQKRWS